MINYTTPTIELTVEGVDLTAQDIYVSVEQGAKELTKTGADLTVEAETVGQVTNTNISFTLTQEESAAFQYGKQVSVQVNWISVSGVRAATEIKNIPVFKNLLAEVIEYGN